MLSNVQSSGSVNCKLRRFLDEELHHRRGAEVLSVQLLLSFVNMIITVIHPLLFTKIDTDSIGRD
jgi:hypothetical protein